MKIPLVDLNAQHQSIKKDIDAAIQNIIETSQFIMGEPVKKFEENWARFCGAKHAICCANGTVAIELALKALGIGKGDEVITVPNTFIATTEAVTHTGATFKFVDIDEKTMLMDPEKIEAAITPKTKAIIPVHLYGQMCDMKRIKEIADKHNLKIIEDAAQAHGAEFEDKSVGHYADVATFSFFPAKILGCMGDGGAVITNHDAVADKIRLLVNHGRKDKYEHLIEGHNYRIDAIQAAILQAKLPYLNTWIDKRRKCAEQYSKALPASVKTPHEASGRKHTYYMYVIRTDNREKLMQHLKGNGIECGIHYPIPLHLQPAYKSLEYKQGDFPVTEKAAKEILSIPLYPELDTEKIDTIIKNISEFFGSNTQ